jgi:hypothetical protein
MFNGNFQEGIKQTATLPEDDPETFALFLTWPYRNIIELTVPHKGFVNSTGQLVDILVFAEKYQIISLLDKAIDKLVWIHRTEELFPNKKNISCVYGNISQGSKSRFYMTRMFVYITVNFDTTYASSAWSNEIMSSLVKEHKDLWIDAYPLLRESAVTKLVDPRIALACNYHQHGSGEPCPYTKD